MDDYNLPVLTVLVFISMLLLLQYYFTRVWCCSKEDNSSTAEYISYDELYILIEKINSIKSIYYYNSLNITYAYMYIEKPSIIYSDCIKIVFTTNINTDDTVRMIPIEIRNLDTEYVKLSYVVKSIDELINFNKNIYNITNWEHIKTLTYHEMMNKL